MDNAVDGHLRSALSAGIHEGRFDAKRFFQAWFRGHGEPHFFLFTKNLKATNMQVAELHALLRTHVRWHDTGEHVRDFQLVAVQDFYHSVQSLYETFLDKDAAIALDTLTDLYADIIRDVVCIQLFFGSCAIFLPCSMTLDPLPMIAESGYIHSCGPSIWNRNIIKATKEEMFTRLRQHLAARGIPEARLIVYAHEDFTKFDRKYAHELKDGLDDVKLHLEKYYIGKESLVQVLQEIKNTDLRDTVKLAEPGHYEKHAPCRVPVIWLLVDRKPKDEVRNRGDEQYYILYEQAYRTENPLHIFDENKPAWIDHTTIPHTLVAAMINITRPWWPKPWWPNNQRPLVIGDPFVGTGTTWLEGLKFGMTGLCADNEPLTHTAIRDNITFFALTEAELFEHAAAILYTTTIRDSRTGATVQREEYAELLEDEAFTDTVTHDYHLARDLFNAARPDKQQHDIRFDSIIEPIKHATLRQRLLFYLLLRTYRRHFAAIDREPKASLRAFTKEANELVEEIESLRTNMRQRQTATASGKHLLFPSTYSACCTINLQAYKAAAQNATDIIAYDNAKNFAIEHEKTCDLIITDPPYGLNAEIDRNTLAQLYQEALRRIIKALADGGQLVMALPDWSHIGKQVPYFITKRFIIQHILAIAEQEGREVVQTAHSSPAPHQAFRPPYYWESERALRRAIIHFRFRDLNPQGPGRVQ